MTPGAGYYADPDGKLSVHPGPLRIVLADNLKGVQEYWVSDPDAARRFVEEITKKLGEPPVFLFSGRQCLAEDDADAFKITRLTAGEKDEGFRVGDSLEIAVFLDTALTDTEKKATWKSVEIVFVK